MGRRIPLRDWKRSRPTRSGEHHLKVHKASILFALLGLVCLGSTSCVTRRLKTNDAPPRLQSDWILPSRSLHEEIVIHADALPWTHGR